MLFHESFHQRWPMRLAIVASLALHGIILFLPRQPPTPTLPSTTQPAGRIEATLAPRRAQAPTAAARATSPPPPAKPAKPKVVTPSKPQERKRILTVEKPGGPSASQESPKWSVAQKEEMNRFLGELESEAKARPSLAERSLAMAREFGRKEGRSDEEGVQIVERLPNSPPIDPFSLEMYFDALVKKLNRSANFVRNDPRSKGVRTAQVVIRLNPSGSLRSFQVVEAGDQQDEIAFIKAVVDQAVPFSPFPPDILKSAQSLAMVICIRPAHASEGGFGFSRIPNGQRC
jgi:hypothetical protein